MLFFLTTLLLLSSWNLKTKILQYWEIRMCGIYKCVTLSLFFFFTQDTFYSTIQYKISKKNICWKMKMKTSIKLV